MPSYAKVPSIILTPTKNLEFDNVKAFNHHMQGVSVAEFIRSHSTQSDSDDKISQSYVSKLRKVNATNFTTLTKLANAFGVDVLEYIASGFPDATND